MYQVLARKYRPRNFIELVGQNHVSRALTSALERGRLHHAYLFTGTRGVGKTTIARILAKCLNCETGVTSTPCEVCATCTAVNEGRFIDLIEIDAASRTKVEDTRELLDNVPYAPTQGRFKVYLIDEVHMLSTHSFNALLKTLEEPPEHVKFLFATTDPQKLPITVISRCLQFTLRPLAVDEITTHLTDILSKEHIEAEQDAIWQIAESAQGSVRDALSLTDQAIAYGQGAIHHQDVKEMLGLIDRTIIFDLILAIHQNQQQRVSSLLMQFRQQALDVSLVLDQLISTLHELALLQYLPDLSLKYSAEINAKIMQLSALISAQDLQLYYQVACKGRADLQLAVTQEQGFEMCVLRLLAFRPIQVNEVLVSQSSPQHVTPQTLHSEQPDIEHVAMTVQQRDDQTSIAPSMTSSNQQVLTHSNAPLPEHAITTDEPNQNQSSDDAGFDLEDGDEAFAVASHQPVGHEPSSDDFLDDELEEVAVSTVVAEDIPVKAQQAQEIQSQHTSHIAVAIEERQADVDLLENIDSENAEPTLTLFGEAPMSQAPVQSTAQVQDIFFLDPAVDSSPVQMNSDPAISALSVLASSVEPELTSPADNLMTEKPAVDTDLMPQDILKLTPQILEGEWSVDKWEFWFRNSPLSPAVQELAQQGLMTGLIDADCIFHIPQKYETLLTQFQMTLESELKNQWPNTRFSVQYQDVSGVTPYDQQVQRKERAYQRASDLLYEEPMVSALVNAFDGQLQNIQLKP